MPSLGWRAALDPDEDGAQAEGYAHGDEEEPDEPFREAVG